jgi:UDP-N-acetylmuramoyl-L-alanyl-D-glutamate--2,6-diaminopimelate ligase
MTREARGATARVSSEPVSHPLPHVALSTLADAVPGTQVRGDGATTVSGVAFDSRQGSLAGCLFFCVPGERTDGHAFAGRAVAAGAVALVAERWVEGVDVPQLRVPSVRAAMGPMSAVAFGRPAAEMTTVGITGTNGKTSTTYLLESIFRAAGLRAGVIGTTGARIDGAALPLDRTTPEAPDLHSLFARMRDEDVRAVAMEVSSHALDQHRVDGVVFDVAVFTNLSQDHLDYHPSMEAYLAAKATLFTPEHARRGVVNADDSAGRQLAGSARIPVTRFGSGTDAQLRATDVRVDPSGISFRVGGLVVRSRLRGDFNVENCLAALAAARELGIEDGAIVRGIEALAGVPGRLEPVEVGQNFLVVVDYAHTPDSILRVLQAARPLASGRLIVVFGGGGERDRAKRPLMGSVATANADLTVLTSDNPRSEDPMAIIQDIEGGAREGGGAYVVEPDRRRAIERAVSGADRGDVVVIAGKGHEPYQELRGGTIPFDDAAVAREALRSRAEGT